jgi:peptide chain release factor 1
VHTSTVTVAIINPVTSIETISKSDLQIEWYSGTGAGGQFRNKHQNSCRITHIPSGVVVTSQTRSRENSLKLAMADITERVNQSLANKQNSETATIRKNQVGSGMRGDKERTIRFQDNTIVDHNTGKRMRSDKFMKGFMDELWD